MASSWSNSKANSGKWARGSRVLPSQRSLKYYSFGHGERGGWVAIFNSIQELP
jgi:hypothetical protein